MTNEQIIANFLKPPSDGGAYTDERLAALLAHAEDGKLAFFSCCCFAGVPTATHALRAHKDNYVEDLEQHMAHPDWDLSRRREMSAAFAHLAISDAEARAKLIPLIKSEISRRESLRSQVEESELVTV